MSMTLLVGGARSGKTAAAERAAAASGRHVAYIATGEARDGEMLERIERHREERPATWTTVEEPREITSAVSAVEPEICIVLDCLTLWVSNRLAGDDATILQEAAEVAGYLARRSSPAIVVTNDVGSGIVPADRSVRRYRDLLGRVNAVFRAEADTAYLCIAGGVVPITDLEL